ncbi:MAG: hypothetical protein B7Z02_09755 [Rhodobacterales bacterium 32-67-9]|nr:MAG: hypothetical protein B7Z02_09755 [Rhodobacterales bacterium 32-67-9]
MEIKAIFDVRFQGEGKGSVWLTDSPDNRIWFERNRGNLASNSALFIAEHYDSIQAALCYMIWGIEDHFPDWQRIMVYGIEPAISVPSELADEGRWEIRDDGMVLHRR